MSVKRESEGLTELLLKEPPYTLPGEEKSRQLLEAIREELIFHFQHNSLYRRFCKRRNFDPTIFSGDLEEIPPIPAQVFKRLGPKLLSVGPESIKVRLHSSATSGLPSTVLVDQITAKRQTRAMARVMVDYLGPKRCPFLILDIDPALNRESAGARISATKAYLNFASKATYVIDELGEQLVFNEISYKNFMSQQEPNQPVVIFGFTYVLYSTLVRDAHQLEQKLPLGSKVIHIGGWKKLESEKVSKDEFNSACAELFGIEPTDVIDIYGFTEQMGLNYPDCEAGWKHVPAYAEILVRDAGSGEVVDAGEVGLLEFLSPVPHSYPGTAIITDDIGVLDVNPGACICGREGTRFKVLGRAKKAEARGCGDVMSAKVTRFLSDKEFADSTEFRVLYHENEIRDGLSELEVVDKIVTDLKRSQVWLFDQPVEAIIGLIGLARDRWKDPEFELGDFRMNGLGFLIDWCEPTNLRRLIEFSLHGRRAYLDGFYPETGSLIKQLRAVPRGLVAHWLSGNVPVLGMLTLVQAMISKNANLLKAASTYSGAIPTLLRSFEGLIYTTPGGYSISGDDLLKTCSVVYFNHSATALANAVSEEANVRIAWGGAEAVAHVAQLNRRWDVQDLMFGPRLSFMVVAAEAIATERQIRKILRRAATDVSVFDQTACASPHTIFVERGGGISPLQFAERLAEEMDKARERIPVGDVSDESYNDVQAIRSVYQFIGDVWHSEDASWTVLYDDQQGLAQPTYSRVITVRGVNSIDDTLEFISDDIQTVGLAAKGDKRLAFAAQASQRGVDRCPDIGMMTNFEMPWDGTIVLERLVRWVSLGGPG